MAWRYMDEAEATWRIHLVPFNGAAKMVAGEPGVLILQMCPWKDGYKLNLWKWSLVFPVVWELISE